MTTTCLYDVRSFGVGLGVTSFSVVMTTTGRLSSVSLPTRWAFSSRSVLVIMLGSGRRLTTNCGSYSDRLILSAVRRVVLVVAAVVQPVCHADRHGDNILHQWVVLALREPELLVVLFCDGNRPAEGSAIGCKTAREHHMAYHACRQEFAARRLDCR